MVPPIEAARCHKALVMEAGMSGRPRFNHAAWQRRHSRVRHSAVRQPARQHSSSSARLCIPCVKPLYQRPCRPAREARGWTRDMIPRPNSTPYLDGLSEKLKADEEKIFEYPGPALAHLQLLARYFHSYNYIELNARRCVETFALAKMLTEPKKGYKNIPPGELVARIREVVKGMPQDVENVENMLCGLQQIEVTKEHRNVFAHFAVRQIPGTETLVFACKDNKDFQAVHGTEIPELGILFSIMEVKNIERLAKMVANCEDWFAHKVTEWFKRHPKVI
jgi:hypothetical protein